MFVLLRFVFGNEIQQQALGLLALATDAVLLCAGVVAVWKLVSAFCRTRRAMPVLGLVVVLSLGWGAYGTRMLWDAGTHLRFLWLRSIYAEIVAKLGDSSFPGAGIYQGVAYQTDEGVELRVAFVWRGITDNWVGVVYDPTGLVMRANEFLNDWSNWKDPDLAEVKGLFGGDMIGARHLEGHWYLCGFT